MEYSYNLLNKSVISKLTIKVSGHIERSVWVEDVFRKEGGTNIKVILIGVISGVLMIGLGVLLNVSESHTESMELPLFSFSIVAKATALFSPDNKLGEGGFGAVYKVVIVVVQIAASWIWFMHGCRQFSCGCCFILGRLVVRLVVSGNDGCSFSGSLFRVIVL
ncbi:S-locus glycoprotein domain-containing protein [Artemisia annua]|uniref:S-locus glycoprotein domain-containing protein n=1 Tax=Artemisia annua TaxID=35608 RepID=A0A2U1LCQ2_ARTAN|nr:S-locus glycoprotein domain-containing protein [Artemisia annua]